MLGPICQKDDDRSRHNLAHGQTTGRGIGPKLPYNVGRDLERDRDGRLDPWHAVPDRLSFAEIAIRLASESAKSPDNTMAISAVLVPRASNRWTAFSRSAFWVLVARGM